MPTSKQPTVYIGVPTGFPKEYATLYMLAALRNIDYPPRKLKVTFAVTTVGDEGRQFKRQLERLLEYANLPYPSNVIETNLTVDDMNRWGPYCAVIKNVHRLRLDFLKSDFERFWLLGGDNPPARDTLKRLVRCKGDVVSGLVFQRPVKAAFGGKPHPVVWQYYWTLKDLDKVGLEPVVRENLRTTWLDFAFFKLPKFKGKRVIHDCGFGSGCSLISREVFEHVGYVLGYAGNHSEDLHFCQLLHLYGFETTVDLKARCFHFDPDGQIY